MRAIFLKALRWVFCGLISVSAQADRFQLVDVNQASQEQLMHLPGVGEKTAKQIVAHREEHGDFSSLDELMLVKEMKPSVIKRLSGKVVFQSPKRVPKSKSNTKAAPVAPQMTKSDAAQLLQTLDQEPSITAVQNKALEYAQLPSQLVADWQKRARLAGWLPQVSVHMGRNIDDDTTARYKGDLVDQLTKRDGGDLKFLARLEWDLSDFAYRSEELSINREAFRMAMLRERILEEVNKVYFKRRSLQVAQKLLSDDQGQVFLEHEIEIRELTAFLDGYTGGWFGQQI